MYGSLLEGGRPDEVKSNGSRCAAIVAVAGHVDSAGRFTLHGYKPLRAPVVPVLRRTRAVLIAPPVRADTCRMLVPDLELFDAHPEWRPLLAAYHERHTAQNLEWSPRIVAVGGLASDQISSVHGKLIALGLLKFEIGNRAEGVHYQITPLGQQALLPAESRQMTPEWLLTAEAEVEAPAA